ncbi:uncharacterized protein LOC123268159 isoform X1 [Cotesia glomerata]|uniref:uncharacterized protein LOC123268159 isoform X1 n=1 Tax=Cotesia glomerata TaxID=32391 RepID=UPI001D030BE7|nr:uncharacterized protein LOC123268159 isoform X1 [Cotesia glomerata]
MRLMGNHEYQKITTFDLYDLFSREIELSELRRRIEAAMNAFKFFGRLEEFDNAENFCAEVYPVANFFLEPLHRESLFEIYSDFMKMVRHRIIAIKKKTPNIAILLQASFHDYYQLMMIVQMKLIALKFFNSLTERWCRNEGYHVNGLYYSYWPRFAFKETKKIMEETLKALKSLNCYADYCEVGPQYQGDIKLK